MTSWKKSAISLWLVFLIPSLLLFQNCGSPVATPEAPLKKTKIGPDFRRLYSAIDTQQSCGPTNPGHFQIIDQFEISDAGPLQIIENCVKLSTPLLRPDLKITENSTDQSVLIVDNRIFEVHRPTWTHQVADDDFISLYCQALADLRSSAGDTKRYEILVRRAHAPHSQRPPDLDEPLRSAKINFQWLSPLGEITTQQSLHFSLREDTPLSIGSRPNHRILTSIENLAINDGALHIDTHLEAGPGRDGLIITLTGRPTERTFNLDCWQAY